MVQCVDCQATKYETKKIAGLLEPLPISHRPWEDYLSTLSSGYHRTGETPLYRSLLIDSRRDPSGYPSNEIFRLPSCHSLLGYLSQTPWYA